MKKTVIRISLLVVSLMMLIGGIMLQAQSNDNDIEPIIVETFEGQALDITLPQPQTDAPYELIIDSLPINGDLTGSVPNVTYTPSAGFSGEDRFSYTLNYADGSTERKIVVVQIAPEIIGGQPIGDAERVPADQISGEGPDDTPLPSTRPGPTNFQTLSGMPINIALASGTDYSFTAPPQNGVLSGQVPQIVYEPDPGFVGSDQFTYSVNQDGVSATYTITINVVENPALSGTSGNGPGDASDTPLPVPDRDNLSGAQALPNVDPALRRLLTPEDLSSSSSSGSPHFTPDPPAGIEGDSARVIISVTGDITTVADAITQLGGTVGTSVGNTIIATLPLGAVEAIANLTAVGTIRLPQRAITPQTDSGEASGQGGLASPLAETVGTGDVVSEGVAAINADDWQEAGFTGAGVKVGVIDNGFDGLNSLEAPCVQVVESASGGDLTAGDHGRQVIEILCDTAPSVEVYAQDVTDEAEFVLAVDALVNTYDVDIITTSVVFPATPGDGSSLTALAVQNTVVNDDIIFVTAAGNNHVGHYEAEFVPIPDGNGEVQQQANHQFCENEDGQVLGYNPENGLGILQAGDKVGFTLAWDDWIENGTQDLDLYMYFWNGSAWEEVARSAVSNNPAKPFNGEFFDPPWEAFEGTIQTTGQYKVAITRFETTRPVWMQLMVRNVQIPVKCQYDQSSIIAPGSAQNAFSVGAADFASNARQAYSGRGRTNSAGGFHPDGGENWEGNSIDPGYFQPQVLGPTSVQTSVTAATSADDSFAGTSASAPHVAGAAALVIEAYPSYTRQNVEDYLRNESAAFSDPGANGPDVANGYGPLWLGNPPNNGGGDANADTVAIFRASDRTWYIRNSNDAGTADTSLQYGDPNSDLPIAGDWDGDGDVTIGIFRIVPDVGAVFHLKNDLQGGPADISFAYGGDNANLLPLVGDWDGDGNDTIGVYDAVTGAWFLRNSNDAGNADISFFYGVGNNSETPIVGDWNGDGSDTVGLFRAADRTWHLRNSNTPGNSDLSFQYGDPSGDVAIAGDWNGDGNDTIGVYRMISGRWLLKNQNTFGNADLDFQYGLENEIPVTGDWDGQ